MTYVCTSHDNKQNGRQVGCWHSPTFCFFLVCVCVFFSFVSFLSFLVWFSGICIGEVHLQNWSLNGSLGNAMDTNCQIKRFHTCPRTQSSQRSFLYLLCLIMDDSRYILLSTHEVRAQIIHKTMSMWLCNRPNTRFLKMCMKCWHLTLLSTIIPDKQNCASENVLFLSICIMIMHAHTYIYIYVYM